MKRYFFKIYLIAVALIASASAISAGNVRLHGVAPDYAGYHIEIYRYADYITHIRELVGVMMVDSVGSFDYSFEADSVEYIFLDLSSYHAHLFVEAGINYEVILPPFRLRPDADRFNPFYKPEDIELGISNDKSQLNEAIRNYDLFFNAHYHSNAVDMVRSRNTRKADELIAQSDSVARLQKCNHPYFKEYVKYREVQIYATPRLRSASAVIQQKFAHEAVAYSVPSYWDALGLIGQSFISSHVRTKQGATLKKVLGNRPLSFADISNALLADTIFANNEMREAFILKGIYDGYYTGYFSSGLSDTLLTTATEQAVGQHSKKIALDILQKKNRLKPGTMAPDFTLLGADGKEHSLSELRGKFVYLAFMHTQNYSCLKEMPALSGIQRHYKRDMYVVGIMTDEESNQIGSYSNNKKIEWLMLSYNIMQNVVLDYGVETMPSYFLIDPEGRISLSPAPSPSENFEQTINSVMKRYKSESLRRRPEKEKTIYDIVR